MGKDREGGTQLARLEAPDREAQEGGRWSQKACGREGTWTLGERSAPSEGSGHGKGPDRLPVGLADGEPKLQPTHQLPGLALVADRHVLVMLCLANLRGHDAVKILPPRRVERAEALGLLPVALALDRQDPLE